MCFGIEKINKNLPILIREVWKPGNESPFSKIDSKGKKSLQTPSKLWWVTFFDNLFCKYKSLYDCPRRLTSFCPFWTKICLFRFLFKVVSYCENVSNFQKCLQWIWICVELKRIISHLKFSSARCDQFSP